MKSVVRTTSGHRPNRHPRPQSRRPQKAQGRRPRHHRGALRDRLTLTTVRARNGHRDSRRRGGHPRHALTRWPSHSSLGSSRLLQNSDGPLRGPRTSPDAISSPPKCSTFRRLADAPSTARSSTRRLVGPLQQPARRPGWCSLARPRHLPRGATTGVQPPARAPTGRRAHFEGRPHKRLCGRSSTPSASSRRSSGDGSMPAAITRLATSCPRTAPSGAILPRLLALPWALT